MFFWHFIIVKEYYNLKASTSVILLKFYTLEYLWEKYLVELNRSSNLPVARPSTRMLGAVTLDPVLNLYLSEG